MDGEQSRTKNNMYIRRIGLTGCFFLTPLFIIPFVYIFDFIENLIASFSHKHNETVSRIANNFPWDLILKSKAHRVLRHNSHLTSAFTIFLMLDGLCRKEPHDIGGILWWASLLFHQFYRYTIQSNGSYKETVWWYSNWK